MDHKHSLMYVLSAIVILNVLAIVLLQLNMEPATSKTPLSPSHEQVPQEPSSQGQLPENSGEEATEELIKVETQRPLVRTLVLTEDRCPDCFNITQYVDELSGILTMDIEEADPFPFRSERLPALAFNTTIEEYPPEVVEGWENYGYTIRIPSGDYTGTWYVLPSLNAPYYDTASNRVVGRVHVTYITMESCEECYNIFGMREFLASSRITPYEEVIVDVTEADALLDKYNITRVPTIIMDDGASAYPNLQPSWPSVGTIEADGSYVLRNLQKLKLTYYDVEQDKVMSP